MESGLVNLRAELHKRKSEIKSFPADAIASNQKHKLKPFGTTSNKPNNVSKFSSFKKKKENCEDKTEEILKLEKSKKVLEEKAALYDKIKSSTRVLEDDELNEKYLIDFQEKIYKEVSSAKAEREDKNEDHSRESDSYKAKDAAEEWVEYVDNFGRTRMCQRQDLSHLQQQELLKKGCDNKQQQKWENIEHETMKKDDVHYQDVLFDEARTHGAGFMTFSRDEAERLKQQQALRELGVEAAKSRRAKESAEKKRVKALRSRLEKVRQRKRLKKGLPCKDMGELKTPPSSEDETELNINPEEFNDVISSQASSPSPPTTVETHVREWDIGKPGVSAIMTQEQWIESRRKVRENEFAPPPSHSYVARPKTQNKSIPVCHERLSPFGPPKKYENQKVLSNDREKRTEIPPPKVLSNDRERCTEIPPPNVLSNDRERRAEIPPPKMLSNDREKRTEIPPPNVLSNDREKRTEIPPPMAYDYYNWAGPAKRNRSLGNKIDIEAAISKGISQLRNKSSGANT